MTQAAESVKTRPSMYAKIEYLAPESGEMQIRIYDLWKSDEKAKFVKLATWAVMNQVELRLRNI